MSILRLLMISVQAAFEIILNHPWIPSSEKIDLSNAIGRVLAEPVKADRDLPPFDRVAMDGIALRFSDLSNGIRRFKKSGMAIAGQPGITLEGQDSAVEVMTGAVLPDASDVVIRYEDLEADGEYFLVSAENFRQFQNIHRKGSDAGRDEVLLNRGHLITPAEIPLLASVGFSKVNVTSLPAIALISTGDELVEADQAPLPHQIRSSNTYALAAGLHSFGVKCRRYHLGDQDLQLQIKLDEILATSEVIILTGGVSKGKLDWVPDALHAAGIQKHFHQVAQRPGKPLWFGTGKGKIVFALPGNPVSVFLCLYKYIRPWLMYSLGIKVPSNQVVLENDFTSDIPLTHFVQAKVVERDGTSFATPVPGGGSGDFANLRHIDGFIEIAPSVGKLSAGQILSFIPIR